MITHSHVTGKSPTRASSHEECRRIDFEPLLIELDQLLVQMVTNPCHRILDVRNNVKSSSRCEE